MTIIKEKYTMIAPKKKYLSDVVVLAQAWKKTQAYIRRHNWYADVLELDCFTIDLENKLNYWADKLKKDTYKSKDMRLVLAPKNSDWYFPKESKSKDFNSWSPKPNENKSNTDKKPLQKLRPLAHISIQDQTIATAAMLCMADAVETAQGPSDEKDFLVAQEKGIYSYGNRLQCEWLDYPGQRKQARFGWGNSRCYREFYEDYSQFLLRPRSICQHYESFLPSGQSLSVVTLDLKGFYDNIDKKALIGQLKKLNRKYVKSYNLNSIYHADEDFYSSLSQIFSWKWSTLDKEYKSMVSGSQSLPEGLPQGLVASGFFSNAYLVEFDDSVGKLINHKLNKTSILLRDYCRYVDDIRLVIEVPESLDQETIESQISSAITIYLKAYFKKIGAEIEIEINADKTKVVPFRQMSTQSNVSTLMTMFQGVLSGTPDMDSLRQVAGGLDGLLHLSDHLESINFGNYNELELSRISIPSIDVRDDTLKRYAATRIVKALRLRRGMTDRNEMISKHDSLGEGVTAGQMLDHEFETAARKLIACWAANPSLSLLLKCGLDLYPHPVTLGPVIDALEVKLFKDPPKDKVFKREVKTAQYLAADLLRSGAIQIGYRPQIEYPETSDILGFRQELARFAKKLLSKEFIMPWYVKQQAALYLASIDDNGVLVSKEDELVHYRLLQESLLYQTNLGSSISDRITVSLVAQQIAPDVNKYVSWFIELIDKLKTDKEIQDLILKVSFNRPDLMSEILKSRSTKNVEWKKYIPNEIVFGSQASNKKLNLINNKRTPLLRIIQSNINPFEQENALLSLARSILNESGIALKLSGGLSVDQINISCRNWTNIQDVGRKNKSLKIFIDAKSSHSAIFEKPKWIVNDYAWVYSLGRILRSCITGELDFTTHSYLTREDTPSYKGLRSTWFSRRFGINNLPQGLLQEPSPISPWLSEFLMCLLQWPGIKYDRGLVTGFEDVKNVADLLRIIDARISIQRKIYGRLSHTPFYVLPTENYVIAGNNKFRVAIVQTLLPKAKDFDVKDPTHWTDSYRAKHRNHIASVCNLANEHLKTWHSSKQKSVSEANSFDNTIDLIVFPELSIHPDDAWLLRGLSDATGASIFAGLTFLRRDPHDEPVNQAIWLLRSKQSTGRNFVTVRQGKKHMTKQEIEMGIIGHRPFQILIEFQKSKEEFIRVAGAICYDATDLALAADLRGVSDVFVISAMNKDVQTFDNMVAALHYHMYQPVILANSGEFGGSTVQAPYLSKHERLVAHVHGNNQVAVSVFEVDSSAFKNVDLRKENREVKTPPAGYLGRS